MNISFENEAQEKEYRDAWHRYLQEKARTKAQSYTWPKGMGQTIVKPITNKRMTTKERKQLRKSWNKLVNEQVRAGTTVYHYNSQVFDEGANFSRKSFETEIRALKDELNRHDQTRIDAALKLANAMAQNTNALSESLQQILIRR